MSFRNKIIAILAAIVTAIPAISFAASMTGTGDVYSYTYNGSRNREYKVYVPQSYSETQAVPMVVALHGCVMDHTDALNAWNWDLIADQNNVIIVFPFVTSFTEMRSENCWGYWFENHVTENGGGEVDDVHGIAVEVESNYNIDPERRYITGLSSGGAMTVASAIAYNEYWAAAAPTAGLAYGDGSSSVTSELFESVSFHVNKINAELDDTRPIPMMVVQSSNDEVVRITAGNLIRDSHLTAFGADTAVDSTEDCTAEGVSCTLKTYNDNDGNVLVKTMFYNGAVAGTQSGSLGAGHYWGGDDGDSETWAWAKGPSYSQNIWAFFSDKTFSGIPPQCDTDNTAPATPTGLAVDEPHDKYALLTINANTEEDLKGYQVYNSNGEALTGVLNSTTLSVSGLIPQTSYTVYAVAVDQCGNQSGNSTEVTFTTTALEYIPPTSSGTCTEHYLADRLDNSEYTACGSSHGYTASVTLYQLQDGSWQDEDPNAGAYDPSAPPGGGSTDSGSGSATPPSAPGSWTTDSSLAGMEVHIYTPNSTTANGKRALMIALHGCNTPNEVVRDNWSWTDEADEYGMVVAAPMAPNGGVIIGCWDYYDTNHSRSNPGRHDDNLIDLAQALIADSNLDIDPDQVYISGLSSGGGETMVMGCMAPEIFAGIGINAGPTVGTASGDIGSVPYNVTASSTKSNCEGFANNGNSGSFATQLTSIVHGNSDTMVDPGYARVAAEAMSLIYGTSKDSGTNSITGGGTETTWSDATGVRISEIMVNGMGHEFPAGDDSSGGSYTNHTTIDYPAFITDFFFNNNRRADMTPTVVDSDSDGVADGSDNCPQDANGNQADADSDGVGDVCDSTPNGTTQSEGEGGGADADEDGILDNVDNCINDANTDQADADADGIGDVCDPEPTGVDTDSDGVVDAEDNCPSNSNANQADADSDGIGDVCDGTPNGDYVPPSATGTCAEHYTATRLDTTEYLACGTEHGYIASITLYQLENGTWVDEAPAAADQVAPATPTGLSVSTATAATLELDWNDNSEQDLAGYKVYLDGTLVATVTDSTYTYTGLTANTSYTLEVAAIDNSSNLSAKASTQGTTNATPAWTCTTTNASTYNHELAGRAYKCGSMNSYACATGSGTNLGYWNTFNMVTLAETAEGHFEQGNCP